MSAEVWLVAAISLSAASVLVASAVVVEYQRGASTRRSLALVQRMGMTSADAVRSGSAQPSLLGELISALGTWLVGTRSRALLRQRLAWAGKVNAEDLDQAVERKIAFGVIGICLGFIIGLRFGTWTWAALPGLAAAGFFLPDLLVYNAGLKRTQEMQNTLPDALDLLNLCVESGLSLQSALSRVSQHQEGAVAQEFGRVLHEMQLGVSRSDAFESLATRTKQEDMQRFVAAMLQVDRLGVPVAAVLREQAHAGRTGE